MHASRFIRYVAPALLWLLVIFCLSTKAGGADATNSWLDSWLARLWPELFHRLSAAQLDALHYDLRKAAHLTEYAILSALTVRALRYGRPILTPRLLGAAWALATAYAATDEFHQTFVPGRTPLATDVLIDSGGALLGLLLLTLSRRLSTRRGPRTLEGNQRPAAET